MNTDTTRNPGIAGNLPSAHAKRKIDLTTLDRLGKYTILLILALVTLRLVFDSYSFYVARRDIDAELQAKHVSSLEYLIVLSEREHALALSSLETRCIERAQLTLFRIFDVENEPIHKVYGELMEQKNAMIKILQGSGRDPAKVKMVTDYIDGVGFEFFNLDDQIKVFDDGTGKPGDFTDLKAKLAEPQKRYREIAQRNAPLRERIEQRMQGMPENSPPSYWSLDAIKTVVERIDQLRDERTRNRARFGDIDEVLARYAQWTGALTGGAEFDETPDPIGPEDEVLREAKCDRFNAYNAAAQRHSAADNAQLQKPDPTKIDGRDLTTWGNAPSVISHQYKQFLHIYFKQPPAAQTLFVTLLLGALGALTLNTLRMSKVGWWADQRDPMWGETVVGPLLGALAAFGIFLIGSTGLLLTSDSHGAQPLSTYFIGLLGFLSGLLYDEAFGRVRRIGTQMFAGTPDVQIANARAEDRTLAEALKGASAARAAGLVLKYGIGTRLDIESEFTLLIPSDEAIGELTLTAWNRLNDEPTSFERWYHHHHAGKRVTRADVAATPPANELRTDDDSVLPLKVKDDTLTVAGIRVVIPDVKWGKGMVHILQRDLG
jgi:uncharacterized surface protein with fasciclin (FAS1) repeats